MAFARRKIQLDPEMKQRMESSSRNIFEVFYSATTTPPPGAFPLWTGEWILNCAGTYPTFYQKAVEYKSKGTIRAVSNADYESDLTTYGECGAFVIQGNDIRLPKITSYVKSCNLKSDIGVTLPPGLPNITGTFGGISRRTDAGWIHPSGALSLIREPFGWGPAGSDPTYAGELRFNANASNSIYGASGTVQPPSVQLAAYIQVYHGVSDQSLVNIGELTNQISQLSAKVTELTRQLDTYKSNNFGAPDHTKRVMLTPETSATELSYTPNVNGYISGYFMRKDDGATQIDLIVNGVTYSNWSRPGSYYVNGHMSVLMPVKAGQTVVVRRVSGNWNNSLNWLYFIPCA